MFDEILSNKSPKYLCNDKISYLALFFQPNCEPGDVIVVLQQTEHEIFTRKASDLYCTRIISITEALCGFSVVLKKLDNRNLVVKSPPGTIISPG